MIREQLYKLFIGSVKMRQVNLVLSYLQACNRKSDLIVLVLDQALLFRPNETKRFKIC